MANLSLALGKPIDTAVNAARGEQGLQSEVFSFFFFSGIFVGMAGMEGRDLMRRIGLLQVICALRTTNQN